MAGTFFPDWGYACLGHQDDSERAHWSPFLQASLSYLHSTYPSSQTHQYKRLLAFILGTVSHSVADIPWHSLSSPTGLIKQARYLDFIQGGDAHSAADVGAEFILAHSLRADSEVPPLELWKWPTHDLVQIYTHHLNITTVTARDLNVCMSASYALLSSFTALLTRLPGESLNHFIRSTGASMSPFINRQFDLWFHGGLKDMESWVALCWGDVVRWIHTGDADGKNKFEYSEKCRIEPKQNKRMSSKHSDVTYAVKMKRLRTLVSLLERHMDQIEHQHHSDQLTFSPTKSTRCHRITAQTHQPLQWITSAQRTSGFGHALGWGDFDGDGTPEYAIGAPFWSDFDTFHIHAGAVFIMNQSTLMRPTNRDSLPVEHVASLILRPTLLPRTTPIETSTTNSTQKGDTSKMRFGWQLATVDLNKDGVDDLAISSPSAGALSLSYQGRVSIYFGQKGTGVTGLNGVVPLVLEGAGEEVEFGSVLESADVDGDGFGDLVVGAPQSQLGQGRVYVYLSSMVESLNVTEISGAVISSPQVESNAQFGSAIAFSEDHHVLFVGAPGALRNGSVVGRVDLFQFDQTTRSFRHIEDGGLLGEQNREAFGSEVRVDGDVLAVGAPGYSHEPKEGRSKVKIPFIPSDGWQSGRIVLFNISMMLHRRRSAVQIGDNTIKVGEMTGSSSALVGSRGSFTLGHDKKEGKVEVWMTELKSGDENGLIGRHVLDIESRQIKRSNDPYCGDPGTQLGHVLKVHNKSVLALGGHNQFIYTSWPAPS